jgi:hypothetical protein
MGHPLGHKAAPQAITPNADCLSEQPTPRRKPTPGYGAVRLFGDNHRIEQPA